MPLPAVFASVAPDAALISRHLDLLFLGRGLQPFCMAGETVFELKRLMHPDHLRVLAVAYSAGRGTVPSRYNNTGYKEYLQK